MKDAFKGKLKGAIRSKEEQQQEAVSATTSTMQMAGSTVQFL